MLRTLVGVVNLCGARNQTKAGTCRRRVRGGEWCYQHPGGGARRSRPTRLPRVSATGAAEIVAEALTDRWRSTVTGQLAVLTTDEMRSILRRRQLRQFDCRVLARLADQLERVREHAHDAAGALAERSVAALGRSSAERALAGEMARRIPLPGDEEIDKVVLGLRIVGVHVCLVGGADVLACPCLRALAEAQAKEEVKAALAETLTAAVPAGWESGGRSVG